MLPVLAPDYLTSVSYAGILKNFFTLKNAFQLVDFIERLTLGRAQTSPGCIRETEGLFSPKIDK